MTEAIQNIDLKTRILLLVEDNKADAELVIEMLAADDKVGGYDVRHVSRLSDAEEMLASRQVDVVLLDLRLPDAIGVDGVKTVLSLVQDMPVVVLTGLEDEALAMRCIDAGAQDFLNKDDLKPALLRRTIGYAITRLRETQVRELQILLENYRALSSEGRKTGATALAMGVGSIRDAHPGAFDSLIEAYRGLIAIYLPQLGYKSEKPSAEMSQIAARIGNLGGGPRDLLDIHVAALEATIHGMTVERTRFFVVEGRLLALEMMGLLVDFYRLGQHNLSVGAGA